MKHCPEVYAAEKREIECDEACDRLENEMHEISRKNMRQLTILQSFGLS